MARCNSCSAPLLANTNRCRYCGVRNDVDLTGKFDYALYNDASNRICPHCDEALQTISLDPQKEFLIERCGSCYGLFFDPDEIERFLESSVAATFTINRKHLVNINADRFQAQQKTKYIKCPVCQNFMSRINFGHRSGVIIDRCPAHGIWLDSGEITHLMEWKRAGGQLLQARRHSQKKKKQSRANIDFSTYENNYALDNTKQDLLISVTALIKQLFG
ncbi:MAG: hypothetical protein CVV13_13250 [Gammaproteobacteria bacterium HGW-Gammaproteobacteria-3]|nr:MAG: hypothetical protein CVV13_13250 [Gammaproteobacteria bacterium HGW-Gammaproteobacteria-3]